MNQHARRLSLFAGLAAAVVGSGGVAFGQPVNDSCAGATPVGNGRFAFDTTGATVDYTGMCDGDTPQPDVWFDYLATVTGFAKVRPDTDAPADLGVTVLPGTCGGEEIACDTSLVWVGDTRQVVFPTVAGQHYLIRLTGIHAAPVSGHVLLSVATPPANDECFTATTIGGAGTFSFDNTLANNSGPDDAVLCDGFGGPGIAHDVWFRWTNNFAAGQDAVISLCGGTRVDTKVAVYHDGCPVGAPLDCNDDFCFLQSRAVFSPVPGGTYLIRIGNWPGMENEPAPDGKPGTFTVVSQPSCSVPAPVGGGVVMEGEPCGQSVNDGWDVDCTNGGHFTNLPIAASVTVFGTAAVLGDVPDQDMYRVTLAQPSHVVFSGTSEFPMMMAVLSTDCPQTLFQRLRVPQQPCQAPLDNPLEIDLDAGTYAFAVANTRGVSDCSAKNNYMVTISTTPCVPPDVSVQPTPVVACTRSSAVFTVEGSGTSPFFSWSRDGEQLFDEDGHIAGAFSSELTILNPTGADVGSYTCRVGNTCGEATSNGAALTLATPCGPADLGGTGGVAIECGDGVLDNNDFVVFIDYFFNGDHRGDVGSTGGVPGADGEFNNNDFVVFIDQFFGGCV